MGFKFTNPINGDKYRVEGLANVLLKKGSGKPAGFNNEHKPLVKRLDFVPPMQAATLKDRFSCEEKDYFISSYTKVANNWEALPTVDEPIGEKHTAGVKFFDNHYTFYVFQRPTADKPWMFCYTVDQFGGEFGDVGWDEVRKLSILNVDLWFEPVTIPTNLVGKQVHQLLG